MKIFLGAETCRFALRQYETRSCLFARQYEEHIDLLNVKCRTGTHGQCSKCQLKNSISDFINSCKRYQHETPSYEHLWLNEFTKSHNRDHLNQLGPKICRKSAIFR